MPLYDIQCASGHRSEVHIPLKKFEEPILCSCGEPARRLISAPMFSVDQTGYTCPITGDWIGSKHQHEENLRRHDCRVLETGEKEAAAAFRKAEDEKLDKTLEMTIEKEIDAWSSAKKEQLHNELVNGKVDLSVDRK